MTDAERAALARASRVLSNAAKITGNPKYDRLAAETKTTSPPAQPQATPKNGRR